MADSLPPGFTLDQDSQPTDSPSSGAPPPLPPGFQLDSDKYGGLGQGVLTAAEQAASGLSLGLSKKFETAYGLTTGADIEGRAQQHNIVAPLANIAGTAGLVGLTGGAGELAGLGELGLSGLAQAGARVGASAVEGGLIGGVNQFSDDWSNNKPLDAQKIAASAGIGALLGGGISGSLEGLGGLSGKLANIDSSLKANNIDPQDPGIWNSIRQGYIAASDTAGTANDYVKNLVSTFKDLVSASDESRQAVTDAYKQNLRRALADTNIPGDLKGLNAEKSQLEELIANENAKGDLGRSNIIPEPEGPANFGEAPPIQPVFKPSPEFNNNEIIGEVPSVTRTQLNPASQAGGGQGSFLKELLDNAKPQEVIPEAAPELPVGSASNDYLNNLTNRLTEVNKQISASPGTNVLEDVQKTLLKSPLSNALDGRVAPKLEKLQSALSSAQDSAETHEALHNFATSLDKEIKFAGHAAMGTADQQTLQGIRSLVRSNLGDSSVWGENAAQAYNEVTALRRTHINTSDEFARKFMTGFNEGEGKEPTIDPSKVKSFLNGLAKSPDDQSVALKSQALDNWTKSALANTKYAADQEAFQEGMESLSGKIKSLGSNHLDSARKIQLLNDIKNIQSGGHAGVGTWIALEALPSAIKYPALILRRYATPGGASVFGGDLAKTIKVTQRLAQHVDGIDGRVGRSIKGIFYGAEKK